MYAIATGIGLAMIKVVSADPQRMLQIIYKKKLLYNVEYIIVKPWLLLDKKKICYNNNLRSLVHKNL